MNNYDVGPLNYHPIVIKEMSFLLARVIIQESSLMIMG